MNRVSRGRAAALSTVVLAMLLSGCTDPTQPAADQVTATGGNAVAESSSAGSAAATSSSAPATSQAPTQPVSVAKKGTALAQAAALPVKGRAQMTGYSRAQFGPAWADVDRNGCDTRNDILRRDLTNKTLNGLCVVLTGTLHDPYNGATIRFVRGVGTSAFVQIDHVVALGDAWQTGAARWTAAKREAFANDRLDLLAVDGPNNEQKGDADAASWLPPNKAYRCTYVARQAAVKTKYGLWVTSAERAAMVRVLSACPTMPALAPGRMILPTTTSSTTKTSSPTPTKTATSPPTTSTTIVHAGAFCSPPGATGVTSAGTPMVCRTSPTDTRYRWRKPL